MKTIALAVLALGVLGQGCSRFRSTQTEAPDGSRTTRVTVTTFFDGKSDLAKLRATTTEKTQGLTLAGLDQSASSTNAVEMLRLIAAIVGTVAK